MTVLVLPVRVVRPPGLLPRGHLGRQALIWPGLVEDVGDWVLLARALLGPKVVEVQGARCRQAQTREREQKLQRARHPSRPHRGG